MTKEAYFRNVSEIGNLYLKHVFFEFEREPILFLCENLDKQSYLCLCSEIRYEQKWIIVRCLDNTLESLIKREKDIAAAFLESEKVCVVVRDLSGKKSSQEKKVSDLDRLDLPKRGTMLRTD